MKTAFTSTDLFNLRERIHSEVQAILGSGWQVHVKVEVENKHKLVTVDVCGNGSSTAMAPMENVETSMKEKQQKQ